VSKNFNLIIFLGVWYILGTWISQTETEASWLLPSSWSKTFQIRNKIEKNSMKRTSSDNSDHELTAIIISEQPNDAYDDRYYGDSSYTPYKTGLRSRLRIDRNDYDPISKENLPKNPAQSSIQSSNSLSSSSPYTLPSSPSTLSSSSSSLSSPPPPPSSSSSSFSLSSSSSSIDEYEQSTPSNKWTGYCQHYHPSKVNKFFESLVSFKHPGKI